MKNGKSGLTLIELLIAISLTTIVGGAIGMIFNAAMETWRFGEEMASFEAVVPPLVNQISEGDYENPGIVDALVITEASSTSIGFVPLFMDHFDYDSFSNEKEIFTLSFPYQSGSPLPKGQVREEGSKSFRNIRTLFLPGGSEGSEKEEDRIQFLDEIPKGAAVRVIYRPNHEKDPHAIMRLRYDAATKEFTREYLGEVETLGKNSFRVLITDVHFEYFSNTNDQVLPESTDGFLSDSEKQQITAAKILVMGKKADTEKALVQFINMRNLGLSTTGIVLEEGMELTIPSSSDIRALAIVNLTRIQGDSTLAFEIESPGGETWLAHLNFGLVDEKPTLMDYTVEYPAGKTVLKQAVFLPVSRGFDMLTFDGTGKYDYDDDGVDDIVLFEDNPVTFRVTEMDIGGAALQVRP